MSWSNERATILLRVHLVINHIEKPNHVTNSRICETPFLQVVIKSRHVRSPVQKMVTNTMMVQLKLNRIPPMGYWLATWPLTLNRSRAKLLTLYCTASREMATCNLLFGILWYGMKTALGRYTFHRTYFLFTWLSYKFYKHQQSKNITVDKEEKSNITETPSATFTQ